MKKRLKLKKHVKVLAVFIFLCILTVTIYSMKPNKNLEKTTNKANSYQEQNQNVKSTSLEESKEKNMANETNKDYIYLSDIPYDTLKSKSGWGSFYKDQASDGTKITIRYENGEWTFDKGMWAHATSTLVYDLTNYSDYDYFTTFAGLNISAKNNSDGVIFRIYTSTDGKIWDKQEESPLLKGTSNAEFYKIDIRNANYLKLEAYQYQSNGSDHSVYADAKLIKESYRENDVEIKPVSLYDQEIKAKYQEGNTSTDEYELLVLQRNFVEKVGEYTLKRYLSASKDNVETYNWLMNDVENLRLYMMGGRPDGSYYNSLTVLTDLLKKYKSDFDITETTKYGTVLGKLYKKMAITLSLTHSTLVGLWMNPNVVENQSNAVVRYQIYKDLHKNGKFVVSDKQDQTKWFEHLEVEEMRFVMNNIIDDEEILWLNEYTQKYIDEHPGQEEVYLQPHKYMKYIWPDYSKAEYYDSKMLDHWDSMYGNFNSVYHITYKKGVEKLWMNLDNGAVCGGISKIGSNIRGVHGTPSSVINQPGHAAIIYYRENEDGLGYWSLDNDVSGWPQSNKTEKLSVRMPLGWGDEEYLNTTKFKEGFVNYIFLSQAALNDYANYEASILTSYQANTFKDDKEEQLKIYRKSVEEMPLNIDAWYNIIELYKDLNKSKQDFLDLSNEIFESLKYYPLPMYHLSEEIEPLLESDDNIYTYQFNQNRQKYLTNASLVSQEEHIQSSAIKAEANYLLNKVDASLASFSFDGDNAKEIVLSEKYESFGVRWDYCIGEDECVDADGDWQEITYDHSHKLSKEEIEKLDEDHDIYVHIVGVNYNPENLYKIDIKKPNALELYNNDLENRVIGATSQMEWKMLEEEGEEVEGEWTSFEDTSPNLTGNKKVEVRSKATGIYIMSDPVVLEYTKDLDNPEEKYIPVSHLSVEEFSTEAAGHGRYATNSIDGNINTSWHSDWNGGDKDKYIIIKLNRSFYLSALDYVPIPVNHNRNNGLIKKAKIELSMTGEDDDWQTVVDSTNWDSGYKDAYVWRTVKFKDYLKNGEKSIEAQYIKITGIETNSNFITAAMFNIYQDSTKKPSPAVELAYSTESPTNEDVIARLVNLDSDIEVICKGENATDKCSSEDDDGDLLTHRFTKNGEIVFKYKRVGEDKEYTRKAKVDWIDKEAPTAKVTFSKNTATNQEVVVTLKPSETVKHLNGVPIDSDGRPLAPNADGTYKEEYATNTHTYTFTENGKFTFEFEDMVGNRGSKTVTVDWIDKEAPYAAISYSQTMRTSKPVIAKLVPENQEKIIVLNNQGKTEYKFTKNGEFEFMYQDEAGNVSSSKAQVNWLVKEEQTTSKAVKDNKKVSKETKNTSNQEVKEDNLIPDDIKEPVVNDSQKTKKDSMKKSSQTPLEETDENKEDTNEKKTMKKSKNISKTPIFPATIGIGCAALISYPILRRKKYK